MTAESKRTLKHVSYLKSHGADLIDNGYNIVPILPGKKAPGFDGWQKVRASKSTLRDWSNSEYSTSGIGIHTRHTPAIDIDVRDDDIAQLMEQWVIDNISAAPTRIGLAPKRLMVFRTDEPFRKMSSAKYEDEWGDQHQIEILGDGQQFVAYHIHPDTHKPYEWVTDANPLNTAADSLPVLTTDDCRALIDYFDEIAVEQGWVKKRKAREAAKAIDADNPFAEDTSPVDLPDDEIRNRLMLVPNPDDHDIWCQVGMALYHQYDGEALGLQFWHEWSETAHNYDEEALNRRWESFGIDGKQRAPTTARYILKLAKEAIANTTAELAESLRDMFLSAKDVADWMKAADETKHSEIDAITRASLATVAKETRERISGGKIPLGEIKKALSYTPARNAKVPGWCRPWVYDISDDRFFNTAFKLSSTTQGFNAMYDRESVTKADILDGKTSPSQSASELALNVHKIPTIAGRRYEPGQDAIFITPEGTFANTYREHEIPAEPEAIYPRDVANINRIKVHIKHLLPDPKEARLFLDCLSWIVQNPGDHLNFAILLQGVEGDGKSFFAMLMRSVMGVSNVKMINAQSLEGNFTDWAVGQCLTCIEEVRLIKHTNKYEIINRVKPMITNPIIEVHPKGKPQYNAKNTTSYMLFTNFKDALPLDDDGRRYLVLFSQWQRKTALDAFKATHPDYYEKLYNTFVESAPAIRQWLIGLEQSRDFKPKGDAPDTKAKRVMIRMATPEFITNVQELIERREAYDVCPELMSITTLTDLLMSGDFDMPAGKAMSTMLGRYGWEQLGRVRVGTSVSFYYTQTPEAFKYADGTTDVQKVKRKLRELEESFLDDEL